MYRPGDPIFAVDGRPLVVQRRAQSDTLIRVWTGCYNTEYQMEALAGDNARRQAAGWMVPDDSGQARLSRVKAPGFYLRTRLAWDGIGWVDITPNYCPHAISCAQPQFLKIETGQIDLNEVGVPLTRRFAPALWK